MHDRTRHLKVKHCGTWLLSRKTYCVLMLHLFFHSVSMQNHSIPPWLWVMQYQYWWELHIVKESFKWSWFIPVWPNVEALDSSRKSSCVQILKYLHPQTGLQVPVNAKHILIYYLFKFNQPKRKMNSKL